MTVLKITEDDYESAVDVAHALLHIGGILAHPTDTVYGLACDATSEPSILRMNRIKGITGRRPFSVMMADFGMVEYYCDTGVWEDMILKKYLPGPYTFILKKRRDIRASLTDRVGVRMPDSPFCRKLCEEFGRPIVTTSANTAGARPPVEFSEIEKGILGAVDVAVDGGRTKYAVPSLVVDLVDMKMLRQSGMGAIGQVDLPER
ncbi:threonylcarbamoyl-AMP synthase [Candidatus Micrarchaeota archaeon]|nr:threonylcarbamoyl-AMP synthase [Candidatus Micrarchaeota archaeon]